VVRHERLQWRGRKDDLFRKCRGMEWMRNLVAVRVEETIHWPCSLKNYPHWLQDITKNRRAKGSAAGQ
jgi:hypothetical protein